jgi:hypothetical protein
MVRVKSVKPEDGYRLWVEFEDGAAGTIDLSAELWGPMFEPLKDVELFRQVFVDEYGVICWPNGADLAPEVVHADVLAAAQHQASFHGAR